MALRLEAGPLHAQCCPTIWLQGDPGSNDLAHFLLYVMVFFAAGGVLLYRASAVVTGQRIAQA